MFALRSIRAVSCRSRAIQAPIFLPYRSFKTFKPRRVETPPSKNEPPKASPVPNTEPSDEVPFYTGPLAKTFQSLKLFSLSSLGLCLSITPFIYIIDSAMATSARTGIVVFAILTSSASTALLGWIGSPYVVGMRRLNPATTNSGEGKPIAPGAVEIFTKNVFLQDRFTRVYDPIFLGPTKRPFAKWELMTRVVVDTKADGDVVPRKAGDIEVAAETFDKNGKIKGKWLVKWNQQPGTEGNVLSGFAGGAGGIVRHFNVHEELL